MARGFYFFSILYLLPYVHSIFSLLLLNLFGGGGEIYISLFTLSSLDHVYDSLFPLVTFDYEHLGRGSLNFSFKKHFFKTKASSRFEVVTESTDWLDCISLGWRWTFFLMFPWFFKNQICGQRNWMKVFSDFHILLVHWHKNRNLPPYFS